MLIQNGCRALGFFFFLLIYSLSCNFVHVTSSDAICREMFKWKNEVQSPAQACLDFFAIASAGIPQESPGYQVALEGSLIQCLVYFDKWEKCKDKSPYWIEVMFE